MYNPKSTSATEFISDSEIRSTIEYTNWELIIVDDGSDDEETLKIIKGLGDEKIKVFHTEHLRPAGARNYGISHATGTYILPLDSDDTIDKTYIQKAVEVIDNNPKVGVVYCQADLFGEKSGLWDLPKYSFNTMLLDNIVFVTALFYKSDWEKVGGFNTAMVAGMEDYDFWLSIMSLGREIYQIPEGVKELGSSGSFVCWLCPPPQLQVGMGNVGYFEIIIS